jgi:predicted DNA-binding transcriptional regulator AlpA
MTKDRLLRINDVLEIIPVAKSTWWLWVRENKAPRPLKLGRTTCWRYSDIMAMVEGAGR